MRTGVKRKKVLVTGGAGFIGSHIVDSLIKNGADVVIYDNFSSGKFENIKEYVEEGKCEVVRGDILDSKRLEKVMKYVDIVSHQAAQLEIFRALDDPSLDLRVNAEGTINVLKAALKNDVEKVIYASSACVYGEALRVPQKEDHPLNPQWPYGVSKLAGEKYNLMFSRLYGLKTVSLRYGIVYGPREWFGRVLTVFIKRVLEGAPPVIFGDGLQRRDFIYISDLVRIHEICLESERANGEVYNVGTGIGTTIRELAQNVIECLGSNLEPIYEDVNEGGLSKYLPRRRIPGELKNMVLSIRKARKELGWSPSISLRYGIEKEIDWITKNPSAWKVKGEIKV